MILLFYDLIYTLPVCMAVLILEHSFLGIPEVTGGSSDPYAVLAMLPIPPPKRTASALTTLPATYL